MHGEEITRIQSSAFWGYDRFQKCLESHRYHITLGDKGEHIKRVQLALPYLIKQVWMDEGRSDAEATELLADQIARYPKAFSMDGSYGNDTGTAVHFYKTMRWIKSDGQRHIDKVIGIMTMKAMEKDMRRVDAELGRL